MKSVTNQDIIALAKQQYEQTKRNTIPTEIISLPSAGKIYPESHPLRSGQLEMRYMTAYDEDILTNLSYIREGIVLDKLIESLIITPGIDADTIAQADKDALIIQARILSYGPEYPVQVTDPATSKTYERTADLTKLTFLPFELQADQNGEFDYQINDKFTLKFSFLTNRESKKITDDRTISSALQGLIKQINASRSTTDIENFIRYEFLARDAKRFREFVQANTPGVNLELEFEGEQGGTFKSKFQIGSNFFWF
jgi:hypothetical protein